MSLIGEGVDFIKASKEWKEEYEKKHNTELYIFRITELNTKLCEENKELKEKIAELMHPKIDISRKHAEILKFIKIHKKTTKKQILQNFNLEYEIGIYELMSKEYVIKNYEKFRGNDTWVLKLTQDADKMIEIIKIIKKYDEK